MEKAVNSLNGRGQRQARLWIAVAHPAEVRKYIGVSWQTITKAAKGKPVSEDSLAKLNAGLALVPKEVYNQTWDDAVESLYVWLEGKALAESRKQ
jgi:hypothetical protein